MNIAVHSSEVESSTQHLDQQTEQSSTGLKKYTSLIVAIIILVLLVTSVLIANIAISIEVAKNTEAVNISGRQRMLSQRISKSIYDINNNLNNAILLESSISELKSSADLFDRTLTAFQQGGETISPAGGTVNINPVESPQAIEAVTAALPLWNEFKERINTLILNSDDGLFIDKENVLETISFTQGKNLPLLKEMNNLTVALEQEGKWKAKLLQLIQASGLLIASSILVYIVFHGFGKLVKGDKQLHSSQRETEQILDTVDEGLFLVDNSLNIGAKHSRRLNDILGISNIKGQNFMSFMNEMISEKDQRTTQSYFNLLFNPRKKERLLGSLNPLQEVLIQVPDQQLGHVNKYVRFSFKRVKEEGEISNILTTISDITQEVKLKQKLKEIEESSDEQMEALTIILKSNTQTMPVFLQNAKNTFKSINSYLRKDASSQLDLVEKAEHLMTLMHKVKGEAKALGVDKVALMAHDFEKKTLAISNKEFIRGQDFTNLTVLLEKMISYVDNLDLLFERIYVDNNAASHSLIDTETSSPRTTIRESWDHLYHLANTVAKNQNKQVEFIASGLNDYPLNDAMKDYINTIATQFIRNSIVHGIEQKHERISAGKPEIGTVALNFAKSSNGNFTLKFTDDGAGLNSEKILAKAIEFNLLTESEAENLSPSKIYNFIFHPKFSTSDNPDEDHGHGVGMSLVKQHTSEANATISIKTGSAGTIFTVVTPNELS